MIIDKGQSDVAVIGDALKTDVRIDAENIGILTQILTSNLYSKPIESFFREIVSNAWDAEKAAGTTDQPIIVRIDYVNDNNSCNYNITIRDYGTGLSPEAFNEIFCSIGASTRRNTNDFIGAFGIGRFSALAITDTVYVSSYYNGEVRRYVIVKSGNMISFVNYEIEKTDEKNGLEYKVINVSKGTLPIKMAVNVFNLAFFPNIYFDGNICDYDRDLFNKRKIREYDNYKVCNVNIDLHRIAIGDVLYNVDSNELDDKAKAFYSSLYHTNVVIKIPIGKVCLTPNREALIYTTETKNILNAIFHAAENEMQSKISNLVTKTTDIISYIKILTGSAYYDALNDEIKFVNNKYVTINPCEKYTFNGKKFYDKQDLLRHIYNMTIPNAAGYRSWNYIQHDTSCCTFGKASNKANSIVLIKNAKKLNSKLRIYITTTNITNNNSFYIIFDTDKKSFCDTMWEKIKNNSYFYFRNLNCDMNNLDQYRDDNINCVMEALYDWLHDPKNVTVLDVNSDRYKNFVSSINKKDRDNYSFTSRIYYWNTHDNILKYNIIKYTDIDKYISDLRKLNGKFVFVNDTIDEDRLVVLCQRGIKPIKVRTDIYKQLVDPENKLFPADLKKDRKAAKIYTIYKVLHEQKQLFNKVVQNMIRFSGKEQSIYDSIIAIYSDCTLNRMKYMHSLEGTPFDPYWKEQAEEFVRRYHVTETFIAFYAQLNNTSFGDVKFNPDFDYLFAAYIIKTKAWLLPKNKYRYYRDKNLLNIILNKPLRNYNN